ncbi:MAG TPA: glycoside hydrolase family 32 protein [Mycobacteriales bacterium]
MEPRPQVHVTPAAGWLNDPVGGLVHDGRYHLFFQSVPGATRWQPACGWAHLAGDDLVRWRPLPPALVPGEGDDGVWSGSAVLDGDGPVLVYTGVAGDDLDRGAIALARPLDDGLVRWRKDGVVLRSPADPDVVAFRDPYVSGRPGEWRMVVGAGLRGRGGAVLAYRSRDLRSWVADGVLATAAGLGDIWECPQYVDLDGPALIVSVWAAGRLDRVAASRGSEVDGRFRPGPWRTLGYGGSAYALTTYRDRAGRLVGTAWLRSPVENPQGWAGMLSLPVLLSAGPDGGVAVAPHPDVDTLRAAPLPVRDRRCAVGGVADLDVELRPGGVLRLAGAVDLVRDDGALLAGTTRVPTGSDRLRVVVDRGVVEAWTGDGRWLALRLPHREVRAAAVLGPGRLAGWSLDPAG